MSSDPLLDSAERLFATHATKAVVQAAEAGTFPHPLWDALTVAGFTAALLPETAGGFGTTVPEAMAILQAAARHAAPVPLAETMLASWLLAAAGLPVPAGVLTLAPVRKADTLTLHPETPGWRLSGTATRIPWARDATAIAVLATGPAGPLVAAVPAPPATNHDANLAGEPVDPVPSVLSVAAEAVAPAPLGPGTLHAAGAAVRTVQIAGALSRALALSVAYAQTRTQFGRPIGQFQAVQHNLAVMAGQSAAATAAAGMATEALAAGLATEALAAGTPAAALPILPVAAAKARAGEAASAAAAIAHAVHGAIGFTQEYELHHATRRLWSWRDEFGNEAEWNALVGRAALRAGAEGLWPALTAAGA